LGNLSLRWRIPLETAALVAVIATGTLIFGVVGTILSGFGAALIAFVRAVTLIRQLQRLTEVVVRTTSIDRSVRLDLEGPSEFQRLARAVNRLVDRVGADIIAETAERIRLSSMLNSLREGVMVVGEDGEIESANPASLMMLNTTAESIGSTLATVTSNPKIHEVVAAAIEERPLEQVEIELQGGQTIVAAFASAFPTPDASRMRALLLLTDITEIRRLDTTRREFVSNASHELRTPIAGVKAAVETLERGALDDPESRNMFFQMIREDAERMENLVEEMLELSRIESGEQPLKFHAVRPESLINSATRQFDPIFTDAELDIRVEKDASTPNVIADPERIDHVLTNLLSNAVRWTEPGGTVTIKYWQEEDFVWFSVSDTGAGIQPEHLPHVFERFFKTDPGRSQPGTGLGLAIARHIVEAHSGEISVSSTHGEGSEFVFSLPTAR